jgi:hypothetical protein
LLKQRRRRDDRRIDLELLGETDIAPGNIGGNGAGGGREQLDTRRIEGIGRLFGHFVELRLLLRQNLIA